MLPLTPIIQLAVTFTGPTDLRVAPPPTAGVLLRTRLARQMGSQTKARLYNVPTQRRQLAESARSARAPEAATRRFPILVRRLYRNDGLIWLAVGGGFGHRLFFAYGRFRATKLCRRS